MGKKKTGSRNYKKLVLLLKEIKEKTGNKKIKTVAVAEAGILKQIQENYKKVKKSEYSPEALALLKELFPKTKAKKAEKQPIINEEEQPVNNTEEAEKADSVEENNEETVDNEEVEELTEEDKDFLYMAQEFNRAGIYNPAFDLDAPIEQIKERIRLALKQAPLVNTDFGKNEDQVDPSIKKLIKKYGLMEDLHKTVVAMKPTTEKKVSRFRLVTEWFIKHGGNIPHGQVKGYAKEADDYCVANGISSNFNETLFILYKVRNIEDYIRMDAIID